MSKLFAVTGQNNRRNAGKRAIDTEILLRESQSQLRDSDRYASAVARMNYLYVGHTLSFAFLIVKGVAVFHSVNHSVIGSAMPATAAPIKLPMMISSTH